MGRVKVMETFRVIEGTVWEIQAETIEEAKAIYEKHFAGEGDDLPMNEIEGSNYWFGTEYNEGATDTLEYLEGVYGEGLHETDIWADYMECDCHNSEGEAI